MIEMTESSIEKTKIDMISKEAGTTMMGAMKKGTGTTWIEMTGADSEETGKSV